MQCNLHNGFYVQNLPKNSEERLKLPKEMRVVNSDCNEWRVRYSWSDYKDIGAFGAGWKLFSVENNLQKGDICIFERVDKSNYIIKLRVHIFRIAEESNNLEDGMNNDRLAIPTSHSNKKMKVSREDLSTNLPAKLGRPEQGKPGAKHCRPEQGRQGAKHCCPEQGKQGAKQVEGKKKKTHTGSNRLKEPESKYAPSISDSKAGYRRSLRFAKRCDLVKPRKKEALCLPSPLARDTDETTPVDDVNGEEENLCAANFGPGHLIFINQIGKHFNFKAYRNDSPKVANLCAANFGPGHLYLSLKT